MSLRKGLPFFTSGIVVKGFGRGSKELGCPTANFDVHIVNNLPEDIRTGIYFGWAQVDRGPVYKMVMCVGWNPYYKNSQKSMETHILHEFPEDFYGHFLRVCVLEYLRPETNFSSLDDLIKQIEKDKAEARSCLEEEKYASFKDHPFFRENEVLSS